MVERVTYVLGAGFSAYAGLPVMNNFYFKAQDMRYGEPDKYAHFDRLFEQVARLSAGKNYLSSDLFNIEEVMSILDMEAYIGELSLRSEIRQIIKDVILHYTPSFSISNGANFPNSGLIRTEDQKDMLYAYFVIGLHGLEFSHSVTKPDQGRQRIAHLMSPATRYAVVSLNYDMVLENICAQLTNVFEVDRPIDFERKNYLQEWNKPMLFKLHGSVDDDSIVPPTWAKGMDQKNAQVWKNAFKAIENTNHLRFVGFSMPSSDAYIQFLFKSAILNAKHLKSIEVICLDRDGSVKQRYGSLITFKNYVFKNTSFSHLRNHLGSTKVDQRESNLFASMDLESCHKGFMKANHGDESDES